MCCNVLHLYAYRAAMPRALHCVAALQCDTFLSIQGGDAEGLMFGSKLAFRLSVITCAF